MDIHYKYLKVLLYTITVRMKKAAWIQKASTDLTDRSVIRAPLLEQFMEDKEVYCFAVVDINY